MSFRPGDTLAHYRLLAIIGQGGMGVVWKALDTKLERHVAVKVLPPERVGDEQRRRRFLREARSAAAVNHANVATIHEVNEAGNTVYIAMELVEGPTLRKIITQGPLAIPRALGYAKAIAAGLARAHKAGVIHRDLKPENIIIDYEDQPKILDFGLAKPVGEAEPECDSQISALPTASEELTSERRILGTTAYMSPEQATARKVDARSDLFSLGIILYEMVTGTRPFQGQTPMETMGEIMHARPEPASKVNTKVEPALDRLLARCMEKSPANRPQSSSELLEALDRLQRGMHFGGNRLARRGAVVMAALIAMAAVAWLWPRLRDDPPPPDLSSTVAIFPFTVRGEERIGFLDEGMVDMLSAMLEGVGEARIIDKRSFLSHLRRREGAGFDPAAARREARQFRAGLFILGDVLGIGDRIQITASVYRTAEEGEAVGDAHAEGDLSEAFTLAGDLALQIVQNLPGSQRYNLNPGVLPRTLPALKHWLRCEKALRTDLPLAELDSNLVEICGKATEEDPEFALGWYSLSTAAYWGWQYDVVAMAGRKAMEHARGLPARELSLVKAQDAVFRHSFEEAERLYRTHLGSHPNDTEALHRLAELYKSFNHRRCRPLREALPLYERGLDLDPENWQLNLNRNVVLLLEREYQKLEEGILQRRAAGDLPDDGSDVDPGGCGAGNLSLRDRNLNWRAFRAFTEGDEAARSRCLPMLHRTDDEWVAVLFWAVSIASESSEALQTIVEVLTDPSRPPEVRAWGHMQAAMLAMTRGQWRKAMAEYAVAEPVLPALVKESRALLSATAIDGAPRADLEEIRKGLIRWIPATEPEHPRTPFGLIFVESYEGFHVMRREFLLALLATRLGDEAAALDHVIRLEELEAPESIAHFLELPADLAAGVRADLAMSRGDPGSAIEHLGKIRLRSNHQAHLWGAVQEALGRAEEAASAYRCGEGRFWQEEYAFLPRLHLQRARLEDRLGNADLAAEHYRRFIAMFSDPDPEFRPVLDEARAALERL